jgi:hypothetical protein
VSDESGETEIRKRAAWLLATLALVAILFAVLMVTVLGGKTGHAPHTALQDPIRSLSAAPQTDVSRSTPNPHPSAENGSPEGSSSPSTPTAGTQTTAVGAAPHSCPGSAPCALDGDIGNAIAAVNAYRVAHGAQPVPGTVSTAAQQCAASNGSHCSGGWAESQVPTADGQAALNKVLSFAHDLTSMKTFAVGWAYDPAGHDYLFAIVQDG